VLKAIHDGVHQKAVH